jgi:predicted MPP superfamily phosphohydrolase
MLSGYDLLAGALTLPPAIAWGLDLRRRRGTWRTVGVAGAGVAVLVSAFTSSFVFAPMRVLCEVIFVSIPLALALAAVRARRPGARASSHGRIPWWAFAIASVALLAVGIDAFFIEPHALQVDRHEIGSKRVDRRLRIVIVADLQFDEWGDYEREAVARAAAEGPDLVVMPGDYLQLYGAGRDAVFEIARKGLEESALRPPLGTYAVEGNIEVAGWEQMFPKRMTTLVGDDVERDGVRVTGLTLGESFDRGLTIPRESDAFHIVVGHAPDFSLGKVDADLLVAGHTHGGQVQLPFIGPLVTFSAVARDVAAGGVFAREGGGHLVVSRGIGMERGDAPRLRFLCKPQIVVIEVVPER